MLYNLALIVNYTSGVISIIFGILYLIKPISRRYTQNDVSVKWVNVDDIVQILCGALIRTISVGTIVFGFVVIVLQYQYAKSMQNWIPITMLISGGIISVSTLYTMILLKTKIPGMPRIFFVLLSVILLLVGYLLNKYLIQ